MHSITIPVQAGLKAKTNSRFRGWATGWTGGILLGALCWTSPAQVWADEPMAPAGMALSTTQATTIITTSAGTTVMVGATKIDVPVGTTITISGTTVTVGTTKIEVPAGATITVVGPATGKTATSTSVTAASASAATATPGVAPAAAPVTPETPPTPSEAMLSQGRRAVKSVDYGAAEKSAQQSLTLAKTPTEKGNALMLLGQVFYSRRQYEPARAQWKRAASFGAEFVTRAYACIGRSYLAEGKTDAAIAQYQLALSSVEAETDLDVEDKGINRLLVSLPMAAIYLQRGQPESARAQFSQIVKSNPDEPFVSAIGLLLVGGIEILRKNPQAALASFEQVSAQLAKATDEDKPYFSPEEVGALRGVLISAAGKPKYQNLSGPEIGNKLLEILVSSFGDEFDSLLDSNA